MFTSSPTKKSELIRSDREKEMETSPATNPPNVPILIGPDRRDILVIRVVTRAAEIWRTRTGSSTKSVLFAPSRF